MSPTFFETIGLTATEARLYELLLKLGEVSAGRLIAETSLKRPTVYKSLYTLERKGLVKKQEKGKIIHFRPEPPTSLLSLAEEQYKTLERAKKDLQSLLPQLTSTYTLAVEKPVMRLFEGVDGLKDIYEDTLTEAKPIYAVLQTAEVEPHLYKWLTTTYVKKRAKLGISAQVIVASGKWSKDYITRDKEEGRATRMVPSETFPFQHEVLIYGPKVGFVHYKKNDALIGIILHHPQIAVTMKAMFDLAWEGASHVEPSAP